MKVRPRLVIYLCLIILGGSIYLNTSQGEFTSSWDDQIYVINNLLIRSLTLSSLYEIFTTPHYSDYYPLTILSYALDYRIWGLNPIGYHLTNIFLHILNSTFLYNFFRFLLIKHTTHSNNEKEVVAALSAFIFLTNPLNVESVAWISERKNVLSMAFFIMAFYTYVLYEDSKRRFYYDISLFAFLLALLSKSSAVIFPVLIFIYDYIFSNRDMREIKGLFIDKIPFFILAIVCSGITILTQQSAGADYSHPRGSIVYTLLTMPKIIAFYIWSSLFPFNLSPLYSTQISESLLEPAVITSIFILTLSLSVIIYYNKAIPKIWLFCIFLFFVPLLPVLHIIPIAVYRADRYLYTPMIGFSLLTTSIIFRHFRISTSFLVSIFIICSFSILTIKQGYVWQNGVNLWEKVVKENPKFINGYIPLTSVYLQEGDYYNAYACATKVLELSISDEERKTALFSRAMALIYSGDLMRGERELERLKKIDPKFPMLFYGLSILYTKKGESENAIETMSKFLELYEPPYTNFEDPLIREVNTLLQKSRRPQVKINE